MDAGRYCTATNARVVLAAVWVILEVAWVMLWCQDQISTSLLSSSSPLFEKSEESLLLLLSECVRTTWPIMAPSLPSASRWRGWHACSTMRHFEEADSGLEWGGSSSILDAPLSMLSEHASSKSNLIRFFFCMFQWNPKWIWPKLKVAWTHWMKIIWCTCSAHTVQGTQYCAQFNIT